MNDSLYDILSKYLEKKYPYSHHIVAMQIALYLENNGVTVQRHGRWITVNKVTRCSECNARINYEKEQGGCFFPDESRYCHNCGADMRESNNG